MSGQVSWEQLSFFVSIIVAGGGTLVAIILWLWKQISGLQRAHDAFRIEVAKEYASLANVSTVERRIETALTQLRADFDRGFERVIDMLGKTIPAAVSAAINASVHAMRKDGE